MPNPVFTFAFILATLIGSLFHLWVGGGARRLASFLLASWLGFAMGQSAGVSLGIDWMTVGEIRMLTAVSGSVLMLMVAYIFTSGRTRGRKG